MKSRTILLAAVFFAAVYPNLAAQQKVSVGFYNVENFFDTIPCARHDDSDYTPGGRYGWNSARYAVKAANIGRVLDDMSLDVVGLAEVENGTVVRDILNSLATDYNFIHTPHGFSGGRGLALLYKGDKFVPHEVRSVGSRTSRPFLYVRGNLCGGRVDIVVCHLPSKSNSRRYRERAFGSLGRFADSLHHADPAARLIIMGDFNATPCEDVMQDAFLASGQSRDAFLSSPLGPLADKGMGSYAYANRWLLYDNIYLSGRFAEGGPGYAGCGIFIRGYMLHDDNTRRCGYPLRTFTGKKYTGGFSDHLPVYVILEK